MWKMGSTHILLFTLALLFEFGTFAVCCPCKEQTLCQPVQKEAKFEVFTFDVGGKAWKHYDWSEVTTIAAFGPYDKDLMCFAHSKGVKVVLGGVLGNVSISEMLDLTNRTTWINQKVSLAKKQFMDGINLDIEQPVVKNTPEYGALTALVNETTHAFHKEINGSQVSFDVAYSPKHSNGRDYDYKGIADSCDLLFVMSYDMNSAEIAGANSPYNETLAGYRDYMKMKIDSKKLVMGVPWYGYDYPCNLNLSQAGECRFNKTTDKVRQIPYSKIMKQVNNSTSGRMWDKEQRAPYYNYTDTIGCLNQFHQVWYDDPESISLKAANVKKLGLRGIGMWNGNLLDYSNNPVAHNQSTAMWNALVDKQGHKGGCSGGEKYAS